MGNILNREARRACNRHEQEKIAERIEALTRHYMKMGLDWMREFRNHKATDKELKRSFPELSAYERFMVARKRPPLPDLHRRAFKRAWKELIA